MRLRSALLLATLAVLMSCSTQPLLGPLSGSWVHYENTPSGSYQKLQLEQSGLQIRGTFLQYGPGGFAVNDQASLAGHLVGDSLVFNLTAASTGVVEFRGVVVGGNVITGSWNNLSRNVIMPWGASRQ